MVDRLQTIKDDFVVDAVAAAADTLVAADRIRLVAGRAVDWDSGLEPRYQRSRL